MKYTKEQRLDIDRRIYDGEITKYEAAKQYGIGSSTARDYMRMKFIQERTKSEPYNLEAYESMSKDELIQELVKARIAEARLKKGYEVKGDGSVIRYSSKNTR